MNIDQVTQVLREYDGRPVKLMEVCGTHTASIFKNGIRSLISSKINLIAGPGCPVCVTPAAYIDHCIEYAKESDHVLVTFGDMMKVPGTELSLSQAKGDGAKVELMYSPSEVIEKAEQHPDLTYVVAAVGFETTVPAYALALEEALQKGLHNIRFVTALKTVLPALDWICQNEKGIDGFLLPGHVSVIIGSDSYLEIAEKYHKPCTVAGFEAEHLLVSIYDIVQQLQQESHQVHNLYSNAVHQEGNRKAQTLMETYFEKGPATWRGLGFIPDSGLYLRQEFEEFDGGSRGLDRDLLLPESCRCGDVIVGRIHPDQCPMFGQGCSPEKPYGPCMVSAEGACGIWYRNRGII